MLTEDRNLKSMRLDQMSIKEIANLMNKEDQSITPVIHDKINEIENLVKVIVENIKNGGRLIYIGAGTSGRLGILDAVECVPTFGTSPDLVLGLIAGGNEAVYHAIEGAEDSEELGQKDLEDINLSSNDTVIGIAASGTTPYVIGGLNYANRVGASTGSIVNNSDSIISQLVDFPIELPTGAEVLTGSTRLKAGTAQKLVLNMISTITMIKLGKVFENLMVDLKPTNKKLVERSKHIIMESTGCSYEDAENAFESSEGSVKLAIVQILLGIGLEEAKGLLEKADGYIHEAINVRKGEGTLNSVEMGDS